MAVVCEESDGLYSLEFWGVLVGWAVKEMRSFDFG